VNGARHPGDIGLRRDLDHAEIGAFAPRGQHRDGGVRLEGVPVPLVELGLYTEYFTPLTVTVRGHGSGVTRSAGGAACVD
jgi:hypothetical protein